MRLNWALAGWLLAGVAAVAAMNWSTPNPAPFLIIGFLIVYSANRIIDRLALVPATNGLRCVVPDQYLIVESDSFHEEAFKVWFVDGVWEAGRSFLMQGAVLRGPDNPLEGLQIRERISIRIYTMSGWFDKARIGWVRSTSECVIGLPTQLSAQVLEDLRNDCHQIFTIGFTVEADSNGKSTFPIYSFEMEQPSD